MSELDDEAEKPVVEQIVGSGDPERELAKLLLLLLSTLCVDKSPPIRLSGHQQRRTSCYRARAEARLLVRQLPLEAVSYFCIAFALLF